MSATTSTQANEPAVVSTPLLKPEGTVEQQPAVSETMTAVITKLANLRERYLSELQAAREKVKHNFLP